MSEFDSKGEPIRPDIFELHTCFNSIHLPWGEMTKENFLLGLEGALDSGYNIA